jgi:hypothetical protein
MAYNVNQLQQLQDMIGMEANVPNAMDRYNAMKLLKQGQTGVRREDGGQLDLSDEAQEIASKGRYGDTMLMHVTPDEVHGLSSLRGGVTINPETGLPEAFDPITMALIGAAIGGVGSAATGGDPLKGAAFGAIGGLMPAAFGAGAGALGLGSAWAGLGAVGQGMMIGGAMGGIRSLFGDSDNPLRDIMLGAAMGGVGGAVFGGEAGAAPVDGTVDAGTMELPTVPTYGEMPTGISDAAGMYQTAVAPPPDITSISDAAAYRPSVVPQQVVQTQVVRPEVAALPPQLPGVDPKYTTWGEDTVLGRFFNDPTATTAAKDAVATDISSAADIAAAGDDAAKTGLGAWWDRREPLEKWGIRGLGALGLYSALQPPPEQQDIGGLTVGQTAFEPLDPKPLQEPIQPLTEEQILAAYSGPSGTGIDTWFRPQVAKEGGLVELDNGGALAQYGRREDNALMGGQVAHISAEEADMLSRMGGAGTTNPVTGLPEYYAQAGSFGGQGLGGLSSSSGFGTGFGYGRGNVSTGGQSGGQGGPGPGTGGAVTGSIRTPYRAPPPPPASPPPPPPEPVDPFVSNVSSFNLQDALARITGQSAVPEQIILPAISSALPIPSTIPGAGSSALSDLFSRFQQKQGDPIVDLVAASGAIPETTTAKEGGLIELYRGGQSQSYSAPSTGTYGGGAAHAQAAAQAASKSQAATQAANAAAAKLGLGPGLGGKSIVGSKGWTNVSTPTMATQAVLNAGRLASNAAAKARGTLFGESLGQALGWGLMHSTPGMAMRGVQALFGGDGPTYSSQAHAAQFSPGLASMIGSVKGLFGIGEGGGEGQTQTGEGQTQTGEGQTQTDSGEAKSNPFAMFNPFASQQQEGGPVGLATGGVFEGRVQGTGDGMADQVAFNVVPQTPQDIPNTPDMALLSSDEYVVPADVVSMLGNGSSTAGAQSLDKFNELMRRKAHGTDKQQKELNAGKELSRLV